MAVAAAAALFVSAHVTTKPAEAAQLSGAEAANILERTGAAPAEYTRWRRGYRRGYRRHRFYGPRFYGRRYYRPRYYRPRYYGRRYYGRRYYGRPRYYRHYGPRFFY